MEQLVERFVVQEEVLFFFVKPLQKNNLINTLNKLDGKVVNFKFVKEGCKSWKIH